MLNFIDLNSRYWQIVVKQSMLFWLTITSGAPICKFISEFNLVGYFIRMSTSTKNFPKDIVFTAEAV